MYLKDTTVTRLRMELVEKEKELAYSEVTSGTETVLRGKVVDRAGRPQAGVYAFVYTEKAMSHKRPDRISRPADESGRYVIDLPQGGKYFLGARSEYGDTPSPGEWYGRYEGTPDHSILTSTGQILDRVDLVVERVLR